MASKRQFCHEEEEEGTGSLIPRSKRSRLWNLCYKEVTSYRFLESFTCQLEPVLRGLVRDEVQKLLLNYAYPSPRPSISQIQEAARFQLFFQSQLPCTFFTGKGIKSKDKMPIQIAIKDATNQTVTSGPLSSLKIKIVVIKGDFNNDGQATWSKNEFYSHIQPERYGKRPLLTGELNIKMQNGVGCIIDAIFTDNSSWTRSGKFRLGAVVSESRYTGERVQEAMTEAFKVKDGRLESSQKTLPPSLNDEVCHLKKIQKDGAFHKKLMNSDIKTVQEFLRAHVMDPIKLRALLGSGMSNKWWEATLKHAYQCDIVNKFYAYHIEGQGIVLVFNCIFQLLGVKICDRYHPFDHLSPSSKAKVNHYKMLAYRNQVAIIELHDSLVESLLRPLLPATDVASVPGSSLSDTHNSNYRATFHDASFNELASTIISQPRFHPLHPSATLRKAVSFRHSSNKYANLSIPGPSTSLTPTVQAISHDKVYEQDGCQVSSRQDFICVPRSTSFATNKFHANAVDEQEHGFQSRARTDPLEDFSMSEEQLTVWVAELLQPPCAETHTTNSPSSPRKWVQLSAAFKLVSVIKRSACRKARIAHPSHQAMVSRA